MVAVTDPHDSIGIIDNYFPDAKYFKEIERFDRFINKTDIDYIVVCSPNYLHDAHCRMGLRSGSNVICEKPLVLNPWNVEQLVRLEEETSLKIHPVLQLRLYPGFMEFKEKVKRIDYVSQNIIVNYVTPRGEWYLYSWKGSQEKSGGIMTNIGVHIFDLLLWLFGNIEYIDLFEVDEKKASGKFIFKKCNVQWYLSIDRKDIKERYMQVDYDFFRIGDIFENSHTEVYKSILQGRGLSAINALPAISLIHRMKKMCELKRAIG